MSSSQQILAGLKNIYTRQKEAIAELQKLKEQGVCNEKLESLQNAIDGQFLAIHELKQQYRALIDDEVLVEQRITRREQEKIARGFASGRLSKADKKEIRKVVYNLVKCKCKKLLPDEEHYLVKETIEFYQAIKKGSLVDTLAAHKKCVEMEYKMMEELLENPVESLEKYHWDEIYNQDSGEFLNKDSGDTEIIRVVAKFLKNPVEARKKLLKQVMEIDARIGYWGLNR